jgi:hypothetical protein
VSQNDVTVLGSAPRDIYDFLSCSVRKGRYSWDPVNGQSGIRVQMRHRKMSTHAYLYSTLTQFPYISSLSQITDRSRHLIYLISIGQVRRGGLTNLGREELLDIS